MNTFICYPKCSTCKRAQTFLEENHVPFTIRHIKDDALTYEELKSIYEKSSLPLKRFFNTSGLLYKEFALKDKLATMSEEEQLTLLSQHGMLVKRPIFVSDNTILVGFKEAEYKNIK